MKLVIFVISLAFASNILAGSGNGKITRIISHTEGGNGAGVFMFTVENKTNAPACNTLDGGTTWALSLEAPSGRAMYSLLLSAAAQGLPVNVVGQGHCGSWPDREEPRALYIWL